MRQLPYRQRYADYKEEEKGCRVTNIIIINVAILIIAGIVLGITRPWNNNNSNSVATFEFNQCSSTIKSTSNYTCCNGLESNCLLRVNELSWAGTHNSYSTLDDGFLAAYNHFDPLEDSLKAGYRVFLLDLCDCGDEGDGGKLLFCHGICEGGTRDPLVVLTALRDFLIANPSEVIMLELQVSQDSSNDLLSMFYDVMVETGSDGFIGLNEYIYIHPGPNDDWPLMNDLIANNTRLIIFQHDGPSCSEGGCPPGFLDTFLYMYETKFSFEGIDAIKDHEASCQLTSRGADPERSNTFFLLNHFANNKLTNLPDSIIAEKINDQSILKPRITACELQIGHQVNIVTVDFWSSGDTPKVIQTINSENGLTLSPTMEAAITPPERGEPTATPTKVGTNDATCANCCNGLESNCDLPVNQALFAMTHNSHSSAADGFLAPNHRLSLEDSLNAGYRALSLDLCDCGDDGLQLCHGFCAAGKRSPSIVSQSIYNFLDENPRDILLLELQVGEETLLWDFFDIMNVTGLVYLMYQHPGVNTEWPTLGDLISNEKRLIVFQHDGPNCDVEGNCPVGIHNTFTYMFETSWSLKGVDEIMDFASSCTVTRGSVSPNSFFILNHFSGNDNGLPDSDIASDINTQSVLESRIAACEEQVGQKVNLIMIDFWSYGNAIQVTQLGNEQRGIDVGSVTMAPSSAPFLSTSDLTSSPTVSPSLPPASEPSKSPLSRTPSPSLRTSSSTPSGLPSFDEEDPLATKSPTAVVTNAPSSLPGSPMTLQPTYVPTTLSPTNLLVETPTVSDCGCGSQQCSASVLDQIATDNSGSFTCRARIIWVMENVGLTERQACLSVSEGFPSICGLGCNPETCVNVQTLSPTETSLTNKTTSPTIMPTVYPSEQPVEQPTVNFTDQQTAPPSIVATQQSNETLIITNKEMYSPGEPIMITFENLNVDENAWVGIEVAREIENIFLGDLENILWWSYVCDWIDVCERPITNALIVFNDGDRWPLKEGSYVAYLARNEASPFGVLATTEFEVMQNPLPTMAPTISQSRDPTISLPTEVPTVVETPDPTFSPTSSPTGVPTELPTASPTESSTLSPTSSPTSNPTAFPSQGSEPCENDIELCNGGTSYVARDPLNNCQFYKCPDATGISLPAPRCLPMGWQALSNSVCMEYPELPCINNSDCTEDYQPVCGFCLPPVCQTGASETNCGGECVSSYCCTEDVNNPATSTWCL